MLVAAVAVVSCLVAVESATPAFVAASVDLFVVVSWSEVVSFSVFVLVTSFVLLTLFCSWLVVSTTAAVVAA